MSSELTIAIVGLVGVIIGGLINGGVSWLLERRQGEHAAKTACRLVFQEMMVNGAALKVTAYHKEWKPLLENLITDDWEANRAVLAGALTDEEWSPLVRAYYWIGQLIKEGEGKNPKDTVDVGSVRFTGARESLHEAGPLIHSRAGVTDPFHPWD